MTTFAIVVSVAGLAFLAFCAWLERAYEQRTTERCCEHLCTSDRRRRTPRQTRKGD